jgi:hypothetical protein
VKGDITVTGEEEGKKGGINWYGQKGGSMKVSELVLCSTQLAVHQRMNGNGFLLPNDFFS